MDVFFFLFGCKRRCGESIGNEHGVTFEYTLDGAIGSSTRAVSSVATPSTIMDDIEYDAGDHILFEANWVKSQKHL